MSSTNRRCCSSSPWPTRIFTASWVSQAATIIGVAADWGYGRRKGWLSDYHLAVRDEGSFAVVGKTL
jgi:hypothetical protein